MEVSSDRLSTDLVLCNVGVKSVLGPALCHYLSLQVNLNQHFSVWCIKDMTLNVHIVPSQHCMLFGNH